jgi:hypothetical protein
VRSSRAGKNETSHPLFDTASRDGLSFLCEQDEIVTKAVANKTMTEIIIMTGG